MRKIKPNLWPNEISLTVKLRNKIQPKIQKSVDFKISVYETQNYIEETKTFIRNQSETAYFIQLPKIQNTIYNPFQSSLNICHSPLLNSFLVFCTNVSFV